MSTLETTDSQFRLTSLLPVVEEDSATGEVAEAYASYRTRFGREHVPGILKCFATHPPLLGPMLAIASGMLFVEGQLSRATKEMIATHVSTLNACPYCMDSHAALLRNQGGDDDLLLALLRNNLDSPSITEKDRRLLDFVTKVTNESYRVSSADIQELRNANWSTPEIIEAVHITALFACFNRVVNAFGLPSQQLFHSNAGQSGTEEKA